MNDDAEGGTPHPGEPQTEEELERLIDKELEDVGKEEQTTNEDEGDIDARQRAIDEELRKLREELLMDSTSPEDMTYDIASRVKQLNEELAKEGPIEEKKNRKVNFHEKIVSMAVPPPEYTEEDIAAANQEAAKLEGSGSEMQSESQDAHERSPQDTSADITSQEGTSVNEAVGDRPSARQGYRDIENSSQEPQPTGKEPNHKLEQITRVPVDQAPDRTDETDSTMPLEGQKKAGEQSPEKPLHQEQAVARTDTEEGSAGTNSGNMNSKNVSDPSDPNDLEVARLTLRPKEENRTFKSQNPGQDATSGQSSSNGLKEVSEDEHVLIERGGKFSLVNVQDLSPEERESLGMTLKQEPRKNGSQLPSLQPKPPQKARPASAIGGESRSPQQRWLPPRSMSAKTSKEFDRQERMKATYEEPFGNQKSRYGMTPEQKEHRREQARLKAQRLKEQKDQEEQERREKEEMCEGVFKAWCEQKKEEIARRKREEKERKKAENGSKEERAPEEAFEAWLHRKKEQKKTERKVKDRMTKEEREAYFMRSREECERAFKRWVRSKNAGLQESHSMSRAGALESKRRAQQSRKSRNLTKALEVAQAYRYNDYYGYRF